jgi:transmembrane sensor
MAEVHHIPDKGEAEREASEWIARLNADDVSADDRERFEAWRGKHPQNARAYASLHGTWQQLAQAGPLVRAVSMGQALNDAAKPSPPWRRRSFVAAAASIAVIAIIVAGYWRQVHPETSFQTAVGEHATVKLPDGSSLELNSNSQARIEYSAGARVIRLERGEAFFEVAHDPQRPFWVVADRSWVRAVGTAFNVYVRPASVEVTVSEGTVQVVGGQSAGVAPSDLVLARVPVSVLNAGQQAEVRGRAATIKALEPTKLKRSVAWRQGTLYFENEPLGDVVAEMNRYTTTEIEIDDDSLRGMPIGGTFRADPQGAEALLAMLQDGFGLRVERSDRETARIESGSSAP